MIFATLKLFNKIVKVFLWVLIALATLIVLVGTLLYIPAIQRFAVTKIEGVVENATGMKLSVGQFRLRFPLGVSLDDTSIITPMGDTLVDFERMRLSVAVWPLLGGEVRVPRISVENARATYRDTTSTMLLNAHLAKLEVRGVGVRLRESAVSIDRTSISGVDGLLEMGESVATPAETVDTTASARWTLELRRTELRDVDFAMHTTPDDTHLAVELSNGLVKKISVNLALQSVTVDKIRLIEGFYSYLTSPDAPQNTPTPPPSTAETPAWSVKLRSLELMDNGALYGTKGVTPQKGFDPSHVAIDSLQLLVEDVSYSAGDISADLRTLGLRERSGLRVTRGEGDFAMTEGGITLDNFAFETPHSSINASAQLGKGVLQLAPKTPVSAEVSATMGVGDLLIFMPLDARQRHALAGKSLTIGGDFKGTLADISINSLTATVPRVLNLNARGNVTSIMAPERLGGRLAFNSTVRNMDFARAFIADTALRRRIGFPERMTLRGRASFANGVYDLSTLNITADEGKFTAVGRFDSHTEEYHAAVDLEDFPLYKFLPADSLGVATLHLSAEGNGLDPFGNMIAQTEVELDHFDYKNYDFGQITLCAAIDKGAISGEATSQSKALVFDMAIDGHLSPTEYAAHVAGKIGVADLYGMGYSVDAFSVTTTFDINTAFAPDTTRICFSTHATLDSTVVHYAANTQRIAKTLVTATADRQRTEATVSSGDLFVDFATPASIDSLLTGLTAISDSLARQFTERDMRMSDLQQCLPELSLSASAGRNNPVRSLARENGMDFRKFTVGVTISPEKPLRAEVEINNFHTGTFTLDTINLWARQRNDRLSYSMRFANRPGNLENLALIYLYGNLERNRARLNVLQRNRADSVGFRFSVEAKMLDSVIRASFSNTPTLGYEQWVVNDNNYVSYGINGELSANLRMVGPHHNHIILQSAVMEGVPSALDLDVEGLEIDHLLELLPTAPPIGGLASCDIIFGMNEEGAIAAKGTLGVDDFVYDERPVADLGAWLDFTSQNTGIMALDSRIEVNHVTSLTAKGTYLTAGEGEMDFAIEIPALAIDIVNAFIPKELASLEGNLDAHLAVKGSPSSPIITGDAGFTEGKVAVAMTGTDLALSADRINMADGQLAFNGFGLIAPNGEKLSVTGGVDISDFGNMKADIAVRARNFEAINSTHLGGSQVYGKAAFNANITARGPLDAMTVRGDVRLRSTTDVTYIMRNQIEQVDDHSQNIVEFMVFADSLFMDTYASVENLRRTNHIDMLIGVTIEDGLKAAASLDELGQNRVALVGGGQLSYSMNSQGDTRLSGRYTLSGGTVVYEPPVISRKEFDVKDGSYVAFTGPVTAPEFHVTATQNMSVDVDMGGGAESVSFDITISIEGSLKAMQITFDVSAPGNAAIQSQLMSMAPEQRMQQALSLMLYNQYTGPGATTQTMAFDARDQLNSFISKEVNQWARNNLRGVDLSVGIDTRDDELGNQHTDYSYSVSKKLFSDRVTVKIGGSVSDNATAQTFSDNLVDDITLEYRLTRRDNMFLKVYHYNTQETIFEGEVKETGVGFLLRKKINRLGELFRLAPNRRRNTNDK